MGLAKQSVVLSNEIHSYFEAVQSLDIRHDMNLMQMRGTMLLTKTELLLQEISVLTEDPEIGITAKQLFLALKVDEDALRDVLHTLQQAKNTKDLIEDMKVVTQIKTLEERLKEKNLNG